MEPVPETEILTDFAMTPVPTLRISHTSVKTEKPIKPPYLRRSTEPTSPSTKLVPEWSTAALPFQHSAHTVSPFSRGHGRSKSSQSALSPEMARASSLPGFNSGAHLFKDYPPRPASPRGSPQRRLLRKSIDEGYPSMPVPQRSLSLGHVTELSQTIPEDSELAFQEAPPRSGSPLSYVQSASSSSYSRIRRPVSPLRSLTSQGGLSPSLAYVPLHSPSIAAYRLSEPPSASSYSSYNYANSTYATSSMPSTPTSFRSRSPSISSLETIEDAPDAEEAAIKAFRIAQLKAATEAGEGSDAECDLDEAIIKLRRKQSLEALQGRGRSLGVGGPVTGLGSRDKRKRWSVCGAERRGDLDLETIWED